MDDIFHELNLYLDPSVAVNMGNSAEQNTAALIASSMNSEYEDDWSTTPSSYRDTHTPLTNSSVSSNSLDHKLGFGESLIKHQSIHDGSTLSAMSVNEEGGSNEESLPLLTFNEYEEIRNYTDLDLLDVPSPTVLNEINAACQPDSIIAPNIQEFKSNDITTVKTKLKKTPSRKKKKQVPVNTNMHPTTHNTQVYSGSNISTTEVNEEGCFLGFNEESLRLSIPSKKKKKQVPGPNKHLQLACNTKQLVPPPRTLVELSKVTQPAVIDGSRVLNGMSNPAVDRPHLECENRVITTVIDSKTQVANNDIPHQDVWTAESPKKDGNILKKKFFKKTLPLHLPDGQTSSSTVERSLVLKPTSDAVPLESKLTTKAPSYLTLFPMRCKEYPMIYSCNHCVGIFTSIRAGQLHDCVKKRRGRKAGTKLLQSYSNNYSDWSLV